MKAFQRIAAAVALVALAHALSGDAAALSPKEIARTIFPATVLIVVTDKNELPLAQGSGFCIESDQVVTNYHVIEGAYGGYVKPTGDAEIISIASVLAYSSEEDLAILKIAGTCAATLHCPSSE